MPPFWQTWTKPILMCWWRKVTAWWIICWGSVRLSNRSSSLSSTSGMLFAESSLQAPRRWMHTSVGCGGCSRVSRRWECLPVPIWLASYPWRSIRQNRHWTTSKSIRWSNLGKWESSSDSQKKKSRSWQKSMVWTSMNSWNGTTVTR